MYIELIRLKNVDLSHYNYIELPHPYFEINWIKILQTNFEERKNSKRKSEVNTIVNKYWARASDEGWCYNFAL